MSRYRSKESNSFTKAVILLIGLIAAFFFYHRITTGNFVEQFLNLFEFSKSGPYSELGEEFSDEVKDSVKKAIAGFWILNTPIQKNILLNDRIELKDNGIIWRIKHFTFSLPSGKNVELTQLINAYINPYTNPSDDFSNVICEMRTLRQVWLYDGDTCDIRNFNDDLVKVFGDGNSFELENRRYTKYTDPDLSNFFPKDQLYIIHKLTRSDETQSKAGYTIDKGKVIIKDQKNQNIDVDFYVYPRCFDGYVEVEVLRKKLRSDLQEVTIQKRENSNIISLVKNYYIPFCLSPQDIISDILTEKSSDVSIAFSVNWKGDIEKIKVELSKGAFTNPVTHKIKENVIGDEIKLWKFQPLKSESNSLRVSFNHTFN
ncbi:MAG: hypothetical protein PVI26_14230 [Chitinispirillia bacterium]|jgi:hypothetical protein